MRRAATVYARLCWLGWRNDSPMPGWQPAQSDRVSLRSLTKRLSSVSFRAGTGHRGAVAMKSGIRIALALAGIATLAGALQGCDPRGSAHEPAAATEFTTFAVSFPKERSAKPLDGRVLLLLRRAFTREPRSHVEPNEPLASPYLFGFTVDGLAPGAKAVLDD